MSILNGNVFSQKDDTLVKYPLIRLEPDLNSLIKCKGVGYNDNDDNHHSDMRVLKLPEKALLEVIKRHPSDSRNGNVYMAMERDGGLMNRSSTPSSISEYDIKESHKVHANDSEQDSMLSLEQKYSTIIEADNNVIVAEMECKEGKRHLKNKTKSNETRLNYKQGFSSAVRRNIRIGSFL